MFITNEAMSLICNLFNLINSISRHTNLPNLIHLEMFTIKIVKNELTKPGFHRVNW